MSLPSFSSLQQGTQAAIAEYDGESNSALLRIAFLLYCEDVWSELRRVGSPDLTLQGEEIMRRIEVQWYNEQDQVRNWYHDFARAKYIEYLELQIQSGATRSQNERDEGDSSHPSIWPRPSSNSRHRGRPS